MSVVDVEVIETGDQEASMRLKCKECDSYLYYSDDYNICCPSCGVLLSSKKTEIQFDEGNK